MCVRCHDRHIYDKKTCIITELNQQKPDGKRHYQPAPHKGEIGDVGSGYTFPAGWYGTTLAAVDFTLNETLVELVVNIDSCRRVSGDTKIGPLDVGSQHFDNIELQSILNQLFSIPSESAIELVVSNARQGLQDVKKFLNSIDPLQGKQGPSLADDLEAGLRNASIQLISNIVFKVGGGIGTWTGAYLAAQAFLAPRPQGPLAPPSNAMDIGLTATTALLTYQAIIPFLEDWSEEPLLVTSIDRILWVLQTVSFLSLVLYEDNQFIQLDLPFSMMG
ncbi:uncharacterized protein KY384_004645 [Bacidia gigantensis]|uniref:uncharacterized protein n=1 Tax=Bacidia gigantensis TaxID=2732470 RepID=UPI001D036D0A|nr:uncharacterized protein KY384_004645 [Bacidia gigantensis]KAG8530607.1 hypothetical protein KY384_004645 [Bacidia gigantensis]